MGGAQSTAEFARLFMVPGMGHCAGGNAPTRFDALAALEPWVEKGRGTGEDDRRAGRRRADRAHASDLRLPAGREVERHRQPGRRGQLLLQGAVRTGLIVAVVVSTAVMVTLGAATRLDPVPLGLSAEFFANDAEAGPPAGTTLDDDPSTHHLFQEWNGSPPDSFSERWTGTVSPLREGTYTFAVDADEPATLLVDGQAIAGPVQLAAGAHQLQLHYAHRGGPIRFNFLWARDHEPLAPVPGWALRPRQVRGLPRLMARAALDRALALSEWVWVGLLVLAAASLARSGLRPVRRWLARACAWPSLRWILAGSLRVESSPASGGDCQAAGWRSSSSRQYIFDALARHFSHGWYDAYPPVHFYLLAAAWSPLLTPLSAGPPHLRRHRRLHHAGDRLAARQHRDGRRHGGSRLRVRHACVRPARRD